MRVLSPRFAGDYEDRNMDCQEAMETVFLGVLDSARKSGWSTPETIIAIEDLLKDFKRAYDEDPVTLKHVVEEERMSPVIPEANDNNRYEREGE